MSFRPLYEHLAEAHLLTLRRRRRLQYGADAVDHTVSGTDQVAPLANGESHRHSPGHAVEAHAQVGADGFVDDVGQLALPGAALVVVGPRAGVAELVENVPVPDQAGAVWAGCHQDVVMVGRFGGRARCPGSRGRQNGLPGPWGIVIVAAA